MILGSSSGAVPLPNKNNSSVAFSASGAVASCVDSDGLTNDEEDAIDEPVQVTNRPAYGMQVTADEDFDGVTLVTFKCKVLKVGNPSGNLECRLYATLGGTLSQTSSTVIDVTTLGTEANELEYPFDEATLSENNVIVLYMASGSSDASNCIKWAGVYPAIDREYKVAKLQGGSWSNADSYTITFSICPT